MWTPERVTAPMIGREEILAQINEAAKTRLQISGEELIKQYCTAGVPNPGPVASALILLDLLDPDDPVFTAYDYDRPERAPR